MRRKKPTIATVAARANVAVSTVSRFLNGHYVSPTVRARLAEVIEALGYSRSWTARNLSLGRRGSIGVAVDSSEDPWFVQVLSGVQEELIAHDASLMLSSFELGERYNAAPVLEWIRAHRIDGLIVAKAQRRERVVLSAAIKAGIAAIAVAPDEAVHDVHVVQCDNAQAGALVADYLVDLGHKRIAFAGGPPHSVDSKQRLAGLSDQLGERGVRLEQETIFSCGSWTVDAGAAFARSFLSEKTSVTAIVLANDALALGLLRVAHEHGVRIPEDLSVVGFDGLPAGTLSWPSLTTVAQPMREMGRVACRRLFDAIEVPGVLERILFRMALVPRESTGPAKPERRPRRLSRLKRNSAD